MGSRWERPRNSAGTLNATVNVLDGTATGSYPFWAADGDQWLSTFTGLGVPGEGIATITETLTITGGANRFAGASDRPNAR